jgi:DNA polymerase III subunit alpha
VSQFNAHNHLEYSFLDGFASAEDSARRAHECGHEFWTVTDHGECSGHMAAAKAAAKYGLGFIPGIEGYWLPAEKVAWHRAQKDRKLRRSNPSHICLLAMNNTGLRNLWALSSLTYTEKYFDFKPIATPELMRQYAEGIYASDGCMLTEFADLVDLGDEDGARARLGTLLDIFGGRFYMELHTWQYIDSERPEHMALNARMRRLNHAKIAFANELGVPLVVVNDSHHAYPEHWLNRELVWAFNTSNNDDKLQAALGVMAQKADHIMAEPELYYWMDKHGVDQSVVSEAIANSYELAKRCEVEIKPTLGMPKMADSEVDDLADLIDACEAGFKRHVIDEGLDQDRYYARLEEELRLIASKHFAGYFNMVRDEVWAFRSGAWSQYVKPTAAKEPIFVGPGRGSVGGSLVAYLTGLDLVDPLKYGTLFSRFLSPGRKGLPDIDIDVQQSQRPELLKYFTRRYGDGNVCAIGTISSNGPRATIKDVGRAMKIDWDHLNIISGHIEEVERLKDPDNPNEAELTWGELIEKKGDHLKQWQQLYPDLFTQAEKMTGLKRHPGVHASGILISSVPLLGAVPMRRTKKGGTTTQFDMNEVEELGGIKNDLLGLRHLDTVAVAQRLIYQYHGLWIDFWRDGVGIPKGCTNVLRFSDEHFRDPAIWDQLDKGRTLGIFQVSTSLGTEAAMQFKPRNQFDMANLTSIVRPGVGDAGLKDVYLRRRAGLEPVLYDHPLMEQIVGPKWSTDSYGILVYQEQIIQCAQLLANFTADEADDLRKAVGKKDMAKLLGLKEKFITGCISNETYMSYLAGQPSAKAEEIAKKIWDSIEAAGRYAFNWSHAVEYGGFTSTWETWLKRYYPQIFLISCMQTDGKKGSINLYIREARRLKINILPPDINKSARKFTIEGNDIRYGLDTVFGVGAAACKDIIAGRPYTSLEDYLITAKGGTDKSVVYNLICIGAFDSFGERAEILQQLQNWRSLLNLAESTLSDPEKYEKVTQRRLANRPDKYVIDIPDFSDPKVVYELEKELVGTYVTVDPMGRYVEVLDRTAIADPADMNQYAKGDNFVIGGQLTSIRPTVTKRGQTPGAQMAHITVAWNEADFRIVCFPEAWRSVRDLMELGAPIACYCSRLDNGCQLLGVERLDYLFDRNGLP